MDLLDIANHLLNFVAPAAVVALLVVLLSRFFQRNRPLAQGNAAQAAINFVVCVAVLTIGLWFFGRDAKMLTYIAMVLASATVQWLLLRAWRA